MTDDSYQYIGGEWRAGNGPDEITVRNPADPDDPIATIDGASREQTAAAVTAATDAADAWAETTPDERDAILYEVADLIEENRDSLAETLTREEGKPISSSRGEVARTAKMFRYFAGDARRATGDVVPSSATDTFTYTFREPLGVVALVTPWNFPIGTPGWKIAPALAAGNAIVFKPSTETPMIAKRLVELLVEAGVPDGAVNLVVGAGSTTGDALTTHEDVDGISFTGSTGVGRHIAESVASRGIPIQTEMGGKNPLVVLPDADLEAAADAAAAGAFGGTGQACTATSRLIVHESVKDEVVDGVVSRAEALAVGPGMDDPDMGPAVSADQDETNFDYVEVGTDSDATLATGGERPDGLEDGYFIRPTVFTDVDPESRLAQEEVFGPVLSVIEVSEFEEAVTIANNVEYGLSASVFTTDMTRSRSFAQQIEAGVVKVNGTTTGSDLQMPFGGMKASSSETHKELGQRTYEFYTHEKAVYRTDP